METQSTSIFYTAVQHAHSGLRWIILVLLIAAIVKAFSKRKGGSVYPGKDKLFLAAFVSVHVQMLLGVLLYFVLSPYVSFESGTMKDPILRFFTVEHFLGMWLAIIIITVGYIKAKRQAELNKGWKTIGVYFLIGLVVMLVSIPWPFRNLGAGWF